MTFRGSMRCLMCLRHFKGFDGVRGHIPASKGEAPAQLGSYLTGSIRYKNMIELN